MTSPDVSPRGFMLFSASVLGWIVWLSYALKFIFGAGFSGGWLLVGVLFSLMAIGVILILKELIVAVEDLRLEKQQGHREIAKFARAEKPMPIWKNVTPKEFERLTTGQAYRIALGLKPQISVANRRRTRLLSVGRRPRWQSA